MAREMKFDMNNMKKILKTECHAKVTLWKKNGYKKKETVTRGSFRI